MNLKITFFSLIWAIGGAFSIQAQDAIIYKNIEQALKNPKQVTHLDLSDQKLKTLPGNIEQLTNLISLDLSAHELQTFPKVILSLKKLKVLKLKVRYGSTKIHEIPAQITQLKQLRHLDISGLPLRKEPSTIYQLKKLEVLKMRNIIDIVDMSKKPREPNTGGYRSSMRGAYQMTMEGIENLNKLKTLDMSYQTWRLKQFPIAVTQLTNLESLDISECWFKTLPTSLKKLKKLKHLNLNQSVQYLKPPEASLEFLSQLKLETLRLSYTPNPNQVLGLLGHPTRLRSLDLSSCNLKKLPELLFQFTQLKQLNLSDNALQDLPNEFARLSRLEVLDINTNKLKKLPTVIGKLTQLKKLDCSQDFMCHPEKDLVLPENFGQLKNLEELNLRGNIIAKLPASFGQLSQLKSLNMYGVSLTTAMAKQLAKLTKLEYLIMTMEEKTELPNTFKNLRKIKELSIAALYCEGVPVANYLNKFPEVICSLTSLESLDLVGHDIKTIPASIGQLKNLKSLNLYDNVITTLPNELGDLTKLTYLNVSLYCIGIRSELCRKPLVLPASLCKLKKLKTLDYGDRKIEEKSLKRIKKCLKLD